MYKANISMDLPRVISAGKCDTYQPINEGPAGRSLRALISPPSTFVCFFFFLPAVASHYRWMKIAIIWPPHHLDADGKRRNLYGSLMSTERRRCHLIRDLIVIIMKKYTRLLHGTLS